LRSDTVSALALVCILCYFGFQLQQTKKSLESLMRIRQDARLKDNNHWIFAGASGIDLDGNIVTFKQPPGVQHTGFFLLHGTDLAYDLNFWETVQSLLPQNGSIRLIGTCDGQTCIEALHTKGQKTPFPIITAMEIAGSQALVSADKHGDFILKFDDKNPPETKPWRNSGIQPLFTDQNPPGVKPLGNSGIQPLQVAQELLK
jgi:hypothetical protein